MSTESMHSMQSRQPVQFTSTRATRAWFTSVSSDTVAEFTLPKAMEYYRFVNTLIAMPFSRLCSAMSKDFQPQTDSAATPQMANDQTQPIDQQANPAPVKNRSADPVLSRTGPRSDAEIREPFAVTSCLTK